MAHCYRMLVIAALIASVSGAASAQQKKTPGKKGVIELNDITIVGRVQKPVAAVDVARIRPKLALAEVRQPFADRIEEAVYREPF
jgi:hypothetical protein